MNLIGDSSSLSINFHLTEACNAKCRYCFATFPHLERRDRLSCTDREALIDLLVDAGAGKINFAGGEPTLMHDLGPLCRRIKKRSHGKCAVSLVTNGAKLHRLLEDSAESIDWVALSIDSADDRVNAALGRTQDGRQYAPVVLELGAEARRRGIRLKCNTVVTRRNAAEDMSDFISALAPERWKLFQMLPVAGENDGAVQALSVLDEEFRAFVERHEPLSASGIEIVPENNAAMTNSYLMISPDGRFFWHVPYGSERTIKYGEPILQVGVQQALQQVGFDEAVFRARGGEYSWRR